MDGDTLYRLLLPLAVSFGIALLSTYAVRILAIKMRWIAFPRKDRWNTRTVALMGGIAVFASYIITLALFQPFSYLFVSLGAILMFAAGFWDDRFELKPLYKFLFQFLAASLLVASGQLISSAWPFWISIPVTYLWIVGITNAFNLLDNMDGLTAGTAVIVALILGGLSIKLGIYDMSLLAFILAGALAGFLVFNYHPAKIFMGDCGSMFIGYLIAALCLMLEPALTSISSASVIPVLVAITFLPIFDTSLVTFARIFKGRSPSQGGSDHVSHRLVFSGLSERSAVHILWGLSIIWGLLVLFFYPDYIHLFYILSTINIIGIFFFGIYLFRLDVYDHKELSKLELLVERMPPYFKRKMPLFALVGDIFLIISSFSLAHILRFEVWNNSIEQAVLDLLPGIIVLKIIIFAATGLYKGIWKNAGIPELIRILFATFVGSLAAGMYAWAYLGSYVSTSVFAVDFLVLLFLLASTRFSWKGLRKLMSMPTSEGANVLLYGAGDAGWMALTEIRHNSDLNFNPVGFVDDSPYKQKAKLQGLEVLGSYQNIPSICEEYEVEQVLICIRNLSNEKKEIIQQICLDQSIKCKEFMPVFDDVKTRSTKSESFISDYQNVI